MAASTGLVLAAGSMVFADRLLATKPYRADWRVAAGTAGAVLVAAGLDTVAPGLGRALGVMLVAGAVLTSGVNLVKAVAPS